MSAISTRPHCVNVDGFTNTYHNLSARLEIPMGKDSLEIITIAVTS